MSQGIKLTSTTIIRLLNIWTTSWQLPPGCCRRSVAAGGWLRTAAVQISVWRLTGAAGRLVGKQRVTRVRQVAGLCHPPPSSPPAHLSHCRSSLPDAEAKPLPDGWVPVRVSDWFIANQTFGMNRPAQQPFTCLVSQIPHYIKCIAWIISHLTICCAFSISILSNNYKYTEIIVESIGKHSYKKMFSFGHCPKRGGGETPARIFWPFFHHVTVPYILTSISCYVILFGHF